MTSEEKVALIQAAVKFGIDAAIAMAAMFKSTATIDDAIAALEAAKTKTAADYIAEAKAATVVPPPTPPAPVPA